ncbi:hypothetical protein FIBSPDRAFT_781757 [Athelia psychrophila]|uniref:Oxo-4-hydroxy-4-carboxy-5-ureidoimidazoline decarboxylase domain-containing protein n=1 Tax=Athelia psychrophila TaxID=1759441 RepID=A0A166PZ14_9AGAM|nr:hypothetical protein FIBSPDRAFT_781757 [Fibularhizoctonia sp. CBS 109695]
MESPIPSLAAILSSSDEPTSPLATTLSVLFESSQILFDRLVPQLATSFGSGPKVDSYTALIDRAISTIDGWDDAQKAQFVAGHPRIGESQHLSKFSANEQGVAGAHTQLNPAPPEVLERLAHLNACYERTYPGLRYITFVNGRSRAVIAEEMEDVLGFTHSLEKSEPPLSACKVVDVGGPTWTGEVNRAVTDVGRITKSRLDKLGLV